MQHEPRLSSHSRQQDRTSRTSRLEDLRRPVANRSATESRRQPDKTHEAIGGRHVIVPGNMQGVPDLILRMVHHMAP